MHFKQTIPKRKLFKALSLQTFGKGFYSGEGKQSKETIWSAKAEVVYYLGKPSWVFVIAFP